MGSMIWRLFSLQTDGVQIWFDNTFLADKFWMGVAVKEVVNFAPNFNSILFEGLVNFIKNLWFFHEKHLKYFRRHNR